MKKYNINMQFLKKSRKEPQSGDIFVFKMPKVNYIFGRVIKTNVRGGGIPGSNLIYIYRAFSEKEDAIPNLDKNNLLIPPITINSQGWLQGYFKTITNKPLTENDILSQHCFKSTILGKVKYFDEYAKELPNYSEPCGHYGAGNHRIVDDEVSKALGIPLAPKD